MTIKDKAEFFHVCEAAKQIFDCVATHERIDGVRWFFRECTGERGRGRFSVTFKSWNKPSYEGFVLAVEARKRNNRWQVDVVRKTICAV